MSEDKKNKDKNKFTYEEELLKDFPKGFFDRADVPKWDPMTVDLATVIEAGGVLDEIFKRIDDPELAANIRKFTTELVGSYQPTLDNVRGHLKDPDLRKKIIEALANQAVGGKRK